MILVFFFPYFGFNERKREWGLENAILIPKGTKIPHSVTKPFQTTHDNQDSVACQITQSKLPETDPKFVRVIWEGDLTMPSGRPAGQQIDVTYEYDVSGMMHCAFLDVASGKTTEISLEVSAVADSPVQDIDKFTVE